MASVLISGANRGLGLEFARQYAEAGWGVFATCRSPATASELRRLPGNVSIYPLDVRDKPAVDALGRDLTGIALDLVIANAGVSGDYRMPPEAVDRAAWDEVIAVNIFGALALATTFKAHLLRGAGRKLVAISSLMGSITRNDMGSQYVYRASKAGLNAVWKSLSVDWQSIGLTCFVIRPGLVRTALSDFRGELEPPESVRGMRDVIDRATHEQNGRFLSYDGEEIPW
jgi:NAD(P)-dependent dehydrogenase (short-subunit alcohol dehydrogenase family)